MTQGRESYDEKVYNKVNGKELMNIPKFQEIIYDQTWKVLLRPSYMA